MGQNICFGNRNCNLLSITTTTTTTINFDSNLMKIYFIKKMRKTKVKYYRDLHIMFLDFVWLKCNL